MTAPEVIKVEFPKSQRDLFPLAAQELYVETYKKSYADSVRGDSAQLSHEGVASRDAWFAVKSQYVEDHVTHKWLPVGGVAPAEVHAQKPSLLGRIKLMFKR
jgi:cation transport regulator ChaB